MTEKNSTDDTRKKDFNGQYDSATAPDIRQINTNSTPFGSADFRTEGVCNVCQLETMAQLTRRASILLMITGGAISLTETDAFSSIDATRSSSAAVAGDSNSLISLNGFDNAIPPL